MKIRIAKQQDADELAKVHWVCSANQPGGFVFKLGLPFLREYYRVMLREKNSLIVCTEDENGNIIGLVTGSLKTEEHMEALRQHRLQFLISTILVLLLDIRLIGSILSRMRTRSAEDDQGFIVTTGARLEFWGWLPDLRSKLGAVEMLKKWLAIAQLLGACTVKHEVDRENTKSVELHSLLGSKIIKEFITPDGRDRLLMEYTLDK